MSELKTFIREHGVTYRGHFIEYTPVGWQITPIRVIGNPGLLTRTTTVELAMKAINEYFDEDSPQKHPKDEGGK